MTARSAAAAPEASVIVPMRNAGATLAEQLGALRGQNGAPRFEVLVVDNLSNDASVSVAREYSSRDARFSCLDAVGGVGVNYARIVGTQAAASDLLLYCDADDVVDPRWVREMVNGLRSYDLVGGVLEERRLNPSVPQSCRASPMSGLPTLDISECPFVPGACLGIHRQVLDAVGGWRADHPLKLAGDDVDLSWRCQSAGHSVGFVSSAVVHYRRRSTTRCALTQFYRYGKAVPYLYASHRGSGIVAWRPRSHAARQRWRWLRANAASAAADPCVRRFWMQEAAFVVGRTTGCVRFKVLCL